MNAQHVFARLLVGAIVVTSAGCASGASSLPAGGNAALPRTQSVSTLPDKAKKSNVYQWVVAGTDVLQYDYPKSTNSIGSITGLDQPGGECTIGKHTFWIVTGDETIDEYAYNGKKLLKTLTDTLPYAAMCAVSSKNGDIAVVSFSGGVVVFKGGKQSGETTYDLPGRPYFAGYDAKGDLFVDGLSTVYRPVLVELALGSSTFESVSLPNTLQFPGSVQWDGKYIAVTDQLTNDVYRYTIADYAAKLDSTVSLGGASDCADTWIAQPYLFCADAGNGALEVYNYPAGGASIATLATSSNLPLAVVQVSK